MLKMPANLLKDRVDTPGRPEGRSGLSGLGTLRQVSRIQIPTKPFGNIQTPQVPRHVVSGYNSKCRRPQLKQVLRRNGSSRRHRPLSRFLRLPVIAAVVKQLSIIVDIAGSGQLAFLSCSFHLLTDVAINCQCCLDRGWFLGRFQSRGNCHPTQT